MSQKHIDSRSVVFVVLISCLFVVHQQALARTRGPQIIQLVIDKLEAFTNGSASSSRLTVDELREADEEFQSWPLESRQLAMEKPQIRLLLDLVIQPVQSIDLQYEEEDYDVFIKQVEQNYAEFRPAYVDSEKILGVNSIRAYKTNELVKKIEEDDPGLTWDHFKRARDEYRFWNEKYEETVFHEDVNGQLSFLREMFNFFNTKYTAVLNQDVYPLLDELRDPNQLKEIFLESLKKRFNLVRINGSFKELIQRRSSSKHPNQLSAGEFAELPGPLQELFLGMGMQFDPPTDPQDNLINSSGSPRTPQSPSRDVAVPSPANLQPTAQPFGYSNPNHPTHTVQYSPQTGRSNSFKGARSPSGSHRNRDSSSRGRSQVQHTQPPAIHFHDYPIVSGDNQNQPTYHRPIALAYNPPQQFHDYPMESPRNRKQQIYHKPVAPAANNKAQQSHYNPIVSAKNPRQQFHDDSMAASINQAPQFYHDSVPAPNSRPRSKPASPAQSVRNSSNRHNNQPVGPPMRNRLDIAQYSNPRRTERYENL